MEEALAVARWYAMIGVLTLLVWPMSRILFPRNPGCAWALARCVSGPLLVYVAWLIASLGFLNWGRPSLYVAVALLTLTAASVLWRSLASWRGLAAWKPVVPGEAVYLAFFGAVLVIRAWKPEIFGLEKFTNWAFINSLLTTQSLPPPDPWFAGAAINYYYFGHVVAAGLIKLADLPSAFGYNIAFAHVFACLGLGTFELIRVLVRSLPRLGRGQGNLIALAGAAVLVFGGNAHVLIYGWIRPRLELLGWMPKPTMPYRFTNSVRFIGYDPATMDKTITEFPGYSVFVGDLHAHVLNLPIAISLLLLAAGVLLQRLAPTRALGRPTLSRRGLAYTAAFSLLLAWSGMGNTWDLPIYLMLLGFVVIAAELAERTHPAEAIALGTAIAVSGAIIAVLLALPFWLQFHPFSRGLTLPRHASPLWQLFVLYGVQYMLGGAALLTLRAEFRTLSPEVGRAIAFVGLLFVTSLALVSIPELIAVKDIYGDEYQRANTMFKTTYQAYVMLGIGAPAALAIILAWSRSGNVRLGWGMLGSILVAFSLSYGWFCYDQELRPGPGKRLSLNGERFLEEKAPGDAQAVRYLRDHPPRPGESILEAASDSFTYGARISTATGFPAVIGWKVHEWLWRGIANGVATRFDEVDRFYKNDDASFREDFLHRYRVRYLIVGKFEKERYPELDAAALLKLGTVVQDVETGTAVVRIGDAR